MKSQKPFVHRKNTFGQVNNHEAFENAVLIEASLRPFCRLFKREVGMGFRDDGTPFKYGLKGETDLSGILYVRGVGRGVALYVEIKTGAGRLSNDQLHFRNMVRGLGALYIEARWDTVEPMHVAVERVVAEIDRLASF